MIRQIGCKYSQALCITSLICKYMPSGVYRMIKEIPASISPGLSRHPWLSFTGVCPLIFTVASPTSYDSLYFASIPSSLAPSHRAASFQQRASALPLRRAKLASCVSSCVLSMALDSADSPTADCGRTIRRAISRTLASSRARASACA